MASSRYGKPVSVIHVIKNIATVGIVKYKFNGVNVKNISIYKITALRVNLKLIANSFAIINGINHNNFKMQKICFLSIVDDYTRPESMRVYLGILTLNDLS
jgi:hypothetical protein